MKGGEAIDRRRPEKHEGEDPENDQIALNLERPCLRDGRPIQFDHARSRATSPITRRSATRQCTAGAPSNAQVFEQSSTLKAGRLAGVG